MIDLSLNLSYDLTKYVQSMILPKLLYHDLYLQELGTLTHLKSPDHESLRIDQFAEDLIFERIKQLELSCEVFSEESKWIKFGSNPKIRLICDPFCNTSLSKRGFRESAIAVTVLDMENRLISCAIADLNTSRSFVADSSSCYVVYNHGEQAARIVNAHVSNTTTLSDAFIVLSSLKQKRRLLMHNSLIFLVPGQLHCIDGAIQIGRLACGEIDAYADPYLGQPLYELPTLLMIERAGGIVTDSEGKPFSIEPIVTRLLDNSSERFRFIAVNSTGLLEQILKAL